MRGHVIFMLLLVFASVSVFAIENKSENLLALGSGINDATENIFEKEINFPEVISPATNFVFGGDATLERLIILIGIWIALFIIVKGIIGIIPIFEGDKVELMASLAITILIIITGVVEYLSSMYFDFLFSLKFIDALGPFKIFVGLIIVVAIAYGIHKLSEMYENKLMLEKGDVAGENLNTVISMGKIMAKSMD